MIIDCKCGNQFEHLFNREKRVSVRRYVRLGWMSGYDEFGDFYCFACSNCGKRFEKTIWNNGEEEYNSALKELK